MKINPLGIQSYQHLNRQNQTSVANAEANVEKAPEKKVIVEPNDVSKKSALAVKIPRGSYAQHLSTEERQALDLLFSKFRDGSRFGSEYSTAEEKVTDQPALGQVIDVKV